MKYLCYSMNVSNYLKYNELFNEANNVPSVAEVHGLICGFICAGSITDGKSWLEPIISHLGSKDIELLNTYKKLLLEIHETTSLKLQEFSFDFELLIPNDDAPLQERAEALSYWCQGFIVALNRAGINYKKMPPSETKEAIHHIIEISKLDYKMIDVTESDELAYNEVMEYVRMAVILVYAELAAGKGQSDVDGQSSRFH